MGRARKVQVLGLRLLLCDTNWHLSSGSLQNAFNTAGVRAVQPLALLPVLGPLLWPPAVHLVQRAAEAEVRSALVVVHSWECLPVSNMQNLTTYLPLQVAHQHGAAHPLHPLSGIPGGSSPSTLAALLAFRPLPPLHHLSSIKGSAAIPHPSCF